MMYLKFDDEKYKLTDNGIGVDGGSLWLSIANDEYDFEDIQSLFEDVDSIDVYGCIVQEDGTETDEYKSASYSMYTKLQRILYDYDSDVYTVWMGEPNEVNERLDEIEEILNEILMEGGI